MRLPVTTIGGYLGAGKTTLINALLVQDHGLRMAILINDFGAISIDEKLILARDGDVITLANGCACCSVADDLGAALDRFAEAADRYDRILLEASGVADPSRIAALARSPGLQPAETVVVADAETIRAQASDKFVGRLVRRQLASADTLVLGKIDLVDGEKLAAARAFVEHEAPEARLVEAAQGQVPLADLFSAEAVAAPALSCAPADPQDASAMFESHAWTSRTPVDLDALRDAVAGLPPTVVRLKGIVADADRVLAVQRAGQRLTVEPHLGMPAGTGAELIIIARLGTLDRARLDAAFDACLLSRRTGS